MEKSKTYPNAWFPIDVLRSARNVIAGSGESATPQLSFTLQVQVNDQESWSFDTEEEFFSSYRSRPNSATYACRSPDDQLAVRVYGKETVVTCSAPTRAKIEAVFSVFEDAVGTSRQRDSNPEPGVGLQSFTLQRLLPSLDVDKALIQRIEQFILLEVPGLGAIPPEKMKNAYTVKMKEASGEEEFASIKEYSADLFPDSISQVVFGTGFRTVGTDKVKVRISVCMDKERSFSELTISCDAENAREISHALLEGITKEFRPNINMHSWFHPKPLWDAALFALAIPGVMVLALLVSTQYYDLAYAAGIPYLLCFIWFTVGRKANPYTAFNTRAQARWSAIWRFLI